jgi:hypothetical protein
MPMPHPFPQVAAIEAAFRAAGRFAAMDFASQLVGEKNRRESDEHHCYYDAYHRFSHGSLRLIPITSKSLGDSGHPHGPRMIALRFRICNGL